MKIHISKRKAAFPAMIAGAVAMAVVAVPGDAYADSRPSYPASLGEVADDFVEYGDPAAWATRQADHANNWGVAQDHGSVCTRAGCRPAGTGAKYDGIITDTAGLTFKNLQVKALGTPSVSLESGVRISAISRLTNNTPNWQLMTSGSFDVAYTSSVTSSVTRQFSTGHTLSAGFKFGSLVEGGASLTTTYTWGSSDSTTTSNDVKFTGSSQQVWVPPHGYDIVYMAMDRFSGTGQVQLSGDLDGSLRQCIHGSLRKANGTWVTWGSASQGYDHDGNKDCSTYSVYDVALAASHAGPGGPPFGKLPEGFGISGHHTVSAPGIGSYETVTGADFNVQIDQYPSDVIKPGNVSSDSVSAAVDSGRQPIRHSYSIPVKADPKTVHSSVTTH